MSDRAASEATPDASVLSFAAEAGFGLRTLRSRSPLRIELLPSGALYALRYDATLINQVLPGPAENGLFRLLVREHGAAALTAASPPPLHWASVVGAGLQFTTDETSATWTTKPAEVPGIEITTTLSLHPNLPAWYWRVAVRNLAEQPRHFDAVLAHDLGLGDEGAVRNNEAYVSQYIDFDPVDLPQLGWTLLARQNQPMAGGRHPWLGVFCATGADAFSTDGWQFFGADHRLTGEPAAARLPRLPSKRLQYECALAALQSRVATVAPGGVAEFVFIARYHADHPAASAAADADALRTLLPEMPAPPAVPVASSMPAPTSVFVRSGWLHGDDPTEAQLAAWFPGPHRHVERTSDGRVAAFFCGDETHVVTRAKEAFVARPHGLLLRSGEARWVDDTQFGVTAYAAGVFSAQSYLGNPAVVRLLSVIRNALNVIRGGGQRVFVRREGEWHQLGVPSAFAMTPRDVRWIYSRGDELVELRAWCAHTAPVAYLDVRVLAGPAREFLITHQLALGANEFEAAGTGSVRATDAWLSCAPAPGSFLAQFRPALGFGIAAVGSPDAVIGGDELLYADGRRRGGPYVVVRVGPTRRAGVIQLGSLGAGPTLPGLVAAARTDFAHDAPGAEPRPIALRIGGDDAGVARLRDIVPWFNHNAAIHFSAPHGLEQYGGGAWGVRDVCQGSLEWLLTTGEYAIARRMLETVFAQQYYTVDETQAALNGTWPQWFMFPPFQAIQQAHSHGDICFWPVKALCDYIEAADDLSVLSQRIRYTDPRTFAPGGPEETLWVHCDRVLAHVESRFVSGSALVNYGDGDWDDTLQPADSSMRTRMISAWTVALAYQTFRQWAAVCRRAGEPDRAAKLEVLTTRMRADFGARLMPDGIVAGFLVDGQGTEDRPLLHPRDPLTGIRYRLLPMTRGILAELFTPDEARRHLDLIARELLYPDGVRLMSRPAAYHGGTVRLFKRAEMAANVGREIGLQYVHAHLRYAEALAKLGDADALWSALQRVNPVGLTDVLAHAVSRQSNVYFSSSDADFADRYEAAARWDQLRSGAVPVRGGWRLYSSGPGLFLHTVRAYLLGIRESFGDVVFDPVLPRSLDGLVANVVVAGMAAEITYRVRGGTAGAVRVFVGAEPLAATPEPNPYRPGGLRIAGAELARRLAGTNQHIEVEL